MEPSEFFDETVAYLGKISRSFNKDEFPDKTLNLIKETCDFIEKEKKCLSMKPVEQQLREALIDLTEKLKNFRNEALAESELSNIFKRKDFVKAKDFFKTYLRNKKTNKPFSSELEPGERSLPAPSTVWRNTFRILQKILG